MRTDAPDFERILQCLIRREVNFIVVGGVAAVLQGAPISTFDLDILYQHTPENLTRLLAALEELDAVYRGRGADRLAPAADHFTGQGHALLVTSAGPLDVLGMIGQNHAYEALQDSVVSMSLGALAVPVLDLSVLVQLKEELDREKDRATLPILRRILQEEEGDGRV